MNVNVCIPLLVGLSSNLAQTADPQQTHSIPEAHSCYKDTFISG